MTWFYTDPNLHYFFEVFARDHAFLSYCKLIKKYTECKPNLGQCILTGTRSRLVRYKCTLITHCNHYSQKWLARWQPASRAWPFEISVWTAKWTELPSTHNKCSPKVANGRRGSVSNQWEQTQTLVNLCRCTHSSYRDSTCPLLGQLFPVNGYCSACLTYL